MDIKLNRVGTFGNVETGRPRFMNIIKIRHSGLVIVEFNLLTGVATCFINGRVGKRATANTLNAFFSAVRCRRYEASVRGDTLKITDSRRNVVFTENTIRILMPAKSVAAAMAQSGVDSAELVSWERQEEERINSPTISITLNNNGEVSATSPF